MRRNKSADCTGEPPGELIASATPESPDSAKARSRALAWLPRDSAVRHCRGPMTPSRRNTATVGGGWRNRSIGRNFRSSRGFITPATWGLFRRPTRSADAARCPPPPPPPPLRGGGGGAAKRPAPLRPRAPLPPPRPPPPLPPGGGGGGARGRGGGAGPRRPAPRPGGGPPPPRG